MVFMEYKNQKIGHFFLIVGTGRIKETADTTYIIADPLLDKLVEIEISELAQKGIWYSTWRVQS